MIRERSTVWWVVLLFIVQYIVSIGGQILQVPFAMRVVLMYVIGIVTAALWLLARYRARGPLRLRADQLRSTGAIVIPVLLDPVTAPVGATTDERRRSLAFAIATPLGLEIRLTDESTVLTAEWAAVSEVRLGHSSFWTANISINIRRDIFRQEWWLVPTNAFGLRRRGRSVFALINDLEQMRILGRAATRRAET